MTAADLQTKWNRRYAGPQPPPQPAFVLSEYKHLLPPSGRALDLACGLGGNALALAAHGLDTQGWDISGQALRHLRAFAEDRQLRITTLERDCETQPPEPDRFDVIVVSHFLHRPSAPALAAALRPGGWLFYQTWLRTRTNHPGPANPAFRLQHRELPALFADLHIHVYRESPETDDAPQDFRSQALLVAQRAG